MRSTLDIREALLDLLGVVEEARRADLSRDDAGRRALRACVIRRAVVELRAHSVDLDALAPSPGVARARRLLTIAAEFAEGAVNRKPSADLLRATLDLGDRISDAADALLPPSIP